MKTNIKLLKNKIHFIVHLSNYYWGDENEYVNAWTFYLKEFGEFIVLIKNEWTFNLSP